MRAPFHSTPTTPGAPRSVPISSSYGLSGSPVRNSLPVTDSLAHTSTSAWRLRTMDLRPTAAATTRARAEVATAMRRPLLRIE